jgi:hypothetical protein
MVEWMIVRMIDWSFKHSVIQQLAMKLKVGKIEIEKY